MGFFGSLLTAAVGLLGDLLGFLVDIFRSLWSAGEHVIALVGKILMLIFDTYANLISDYPAVTTVVQGFCGETKIHQNAACGGLAPH